MIIAIVLAAIIVLPFIPIPFSIQGKADFDELTVYLKFRLIFPFSASFEIGKGRKKKGNIPVDTLKMAVKTAKIRKAYLHSELSLESVFTPFPSLFCSLTSALESFLYGKGVPLVKSSAISPSTGSAAYFYFEFSFAIRHVLVIIFTLLTNTKKNDKENVKPTARKLTVGKKGL